jgi:hypothetical protein
VTARISVKREPIGSIAGRTSQTRERKMKSLQTDVKSKMEVREFVRFVRFGKAGFELRILYESCSSYYNLLCTEWRFAIQIANSLFGSRIVRFPVTVVMSWSPKISLCSDLAIILTLNKPGSFQWRGHGKQKYRSEQFLGPYVVRLPGPANSLSRGGARGAAGGTISNHRKTAVVVVVSY